MIIHVNKFDRLIFEIRFRVGILKLFILKYSFRDKIILLRNKEFRKEFFNKSVLSHIKV